MPLHHASRKWSRESLTESSISILQRRQQYIRHAFCERRFRIILSASILVSLFALIVTFVKIWLLLLSQQTYIFQVGVSPLNRVNPRIDFHIFSSEYHKVVTNLNRDHSVLSDQPTSPSESAEHDYASRKYVLVLDFWERMINIQSGLRRLVQLGVDSGFTVVEPFVYESRVSPKFSFPEDFKTRNMTPQTAALYFRTEDLYMTNRYVSHAQFREQARLLLADKENKSDGANIQTTNSLKEQYLIHAAIYINWTSTKADLEQPFSWCDGILVRKGIPKSEIGWLLGSTIHVQRALCLSSAATVAPAKFSSRLFDNMFAFVSSGTKYYPQNCGQCAILAFMNYRKHAFTGFVAHTGAMPFKQKSPPLEVGALPQALAERVRAELLEGRPYVAIQLRTGKAFSLLERYERRQMSQGIRVSRHSNFRTWLNNCTTRLVKTAKEVSQQLGPRAMFYIASDMYNDGWKGGEICPPVVHEALEGSKAFLDRELKRLRWFSPEKFGIMQDAMGISGLADAAVCLKADRFVFAVPSNFGKWVYEQRSSARESPETVKVDCMDSRFIGV